MSEDSKNPVANFEHDATLALSKTLIINNLRAFPMNEKNWDLFNKEQKEECLGILMATTIEPKIEDISTAIYAIKNKYKLTLTQQPTTAASSDKAARRKARRDKRKMENGQEVTPTVRGGKNTLILQDTVTKEITRFRVRAKGAPKYADNGINRPVTLFDASGEGTQINFVFNPRPNSDSVRTGFSWNNNWYIKDDEDFFNKVSEAITAPLPATEAIGKEGEEGYQPAKPIQQGEYKELSFNILEAAPAKEKTEETSTEEGGEEKPKAKRKAKASTTEDAPAETEAE